MNESMHEMEVINLEEEKAYIEVSQQGGSSSGFHNNAAWGKNKQLQLDASQMHQFVKVGKSIIDEMRQFESDEIEVSFGIKAGGEGALLCFAKASTEAQFNVKLSWKKKDE